MAFNFARLPDMVIPSGQQNSNAVSPIDDCYGLSINSPAALTGTITVEVEMTATGTNFVTLQSGGADITLAAAKGTILTPLPYLQIRVHSNQAEGASRTFPTSKVFPV